jgi:putative tryptophan/tyrosine transport system substrate-binding protein
MNRRKLVIGVAGLLLAAPLAALAQAAARVYRVGLLTTTTPVATWRNLPAFGAFLDELHKLGYAEGRDIIFEYRSAEGEWQRLPNLATELANLKVDVIVVPVCGAVLNAARAATRTIPIVVQSCSDDMVATGVVASLARPGGNITGLSKITPQLASKQLELLEESVPNLSRVAVLWDPGYLDVTADLQDLRAAAQRVSVTLLPTEAHGRDQLAAAFTRMVRDHADAVITFSDATTYNYPRHIAELAIKSRLPVISPFREVVEAGGLMSYGPNILDMWRRSAGYVDKILKGAKAGDLPIEQPLKFELLINLKTAKALGLTIPQSVLLRADELIQ